MKFKKQLRYSIIYNVNRLKKYLKERESRVTFFGSILLFILGCFGFFLGVYFWQAPINMMSYSIDANLTGFGLGCGDVLPLSWITWVHLEDNFEDTLFGFEFTYQARRVGEHNISFLVPFKIAQGKGRLSSQNGFTYEEFDQGTLVYGKVSVETQDIDTRKTLHFSFLIQNTFIHGREGRYLLFFPFEERDHDDKIMDFLQELRIPIIMGGYFFRFDFRHPVTYSMQYSLPQYVLGPYIHTQFDTSYLGYQWVPEYHQPITISLESYQEISQKERYQFYSGLSFGIGIPLLIEGLKGMIRNRWNALVNT